MMTHLYLVRHGIAVPHGTTDVPEEERPLTPEGERRMRQIGRGLRRLGVKTDRVVSSPLPRALRTAEIVAEALGLTDRLESSDSLRPGREATSIRDWLLTRGEERLMLVGHNPSFSDLVGLFMTRGTGTTPCELRKGGVAAFRAEAQGGLRLDWLARPMLLRRIAD